MLDGQSLRGETLEGKAKAVVSSRHNVPRN
jgi:hypothetical protein